MKKIAVFAVVLASLMSCVVLASEEVFDTECDIYDVNSVCENFDVNLMGVDENTKDTFEAKVIAAWDNMSSSVALYPDVKIKASEINSYFATALYENPQYYYVNRSYSYTKKGDYVSELRKMTYTEQSKEDVEKTHREIAKATDEILLTITKDMTDEEKIFAVHDYLALNYVYDIEDMDQTYMILLKKSGVCAAYSEAFQHLMNVLNINCTLVSSDEMQHIWNMVELDGEWYHIDVTWDDPSYDRFAMVSHEYLLLSEDGLKSLDHSGFNSPYAATNTKHEKEAWRDSTAGIVTCNGVLYYVSENRIVDETGKVIFENLDGGDGKWSLGGNRFFKGGVYAGLCTINGMLYFNTDKAIYSYDPIDQTVKIVLEKAGICGLYADKNKLVYNKFDASMGLFVKDGEMRVCDVVVNKPFVENGEVKVRLFNDGDCVVWVIVGEKYEIEKLEKGDLVNLEFGTEMGAVYIWKSDMKPLTEKFEIK